MPDDLTSAQLRRALRATQELAEIRDLDEFPTRVAASIRHLIGADHAGYNALDLDGGHAFVVADPPDSVLELGVADFARLIHQNPLVVHTTATGDTTALRLSDFISLRELHRTELYQAVYRLIPQEHQLAVQLIPRAPHGFPAQLVGISLGRADRDFTRGEQRLLTALQPHLQATHARLLELAFARAVLADDDTRRAACLVNRRHVVTWASPGAEELGIRSGELLPRAIRASRADTGPALATLEGRRVRVSLVRDAYPGLVAVHLVAIAAGRDAWRLTRLAGLTHRECEVMALALGGRTSQEIATALGLKRRTVEKHFERIYARLGVSNRSQAVLAAIDLLES